MVRQTFMLIFDYMKVEYFKDNNINKNNKDIFKYVLKRNQKEKLRFDKNILNLAKKKCITKDASSKSVYDHRMTVFNSRKGSSYLVYGTNDYSIVLLNVVLFTITQKVENAHSDNITLCRHYHDKVYDRDLILTTSYDYSVKIWKLVNNNKLENILILSNVGLDHGLLSCLILNESHQYIVTCSIYHEFCLWNFKGEFIRKNLSEKFLFLIESWYDQKLGESYVIIGNDSNVISYTLNDLKIYKTYSDGKVSNHFSVTVTQDAKLYETDRKGDLRIWNFHSAELLLRIESFYELNGLSIWNDQFVLAGGSVGKMILFDLESREVKKVYKINDSFVRNVVSFIHPLYGACIFTYSSTGIIDILFSD